MRFLFFLLLISTTLLANEKPAVIVAVSNEPTTVGLKEAIELGWEDGGATVPIEKFIEVDGSAENMRMVAQELVKSYADRPIILFAGWHMRELQSAAEVFNNDQKSKLPRFAISSGSLERTLPPGCASSAPSISFATMGAHLYAQAMDSSAVIIIQGKRVFANEYVDSFKSQTPLQKTKIAGIYEIPEVTSRELLLEAVAPAFEAIKNMPSPVLILWVNDAKSLEEISPEISQLPQGTRVLCSPLADGLQDRFGKIPVAVIIPSILDNTSTTAYVTTTLYQKKALQDSNLSWCVWNAYDGARAVSALVRTGHPVNLESLAIRVDASIPAASLGPGWFDAKTGRSPYGVFWIINVHDKMMQPEDLPAFRRRVKGAIFSLPDSAGCVASVGHAPWVGNFPWYIQAYRWQKLVSEGKPDIIKHSGEVLSHDSGAIFSSTEVAIPLYLNKDQVRGYRQEDVPQCEPMQALDFPYPLPSYTMRY